MHVNVGLKLMVHSCPHVTCGSLTMERKLLNKEEIWGDDLADSHSVVWGMWRWPLGKTRQIKTLLPCYHIMFTLLHCAQKQCCQVTFSIWNEICLRGDGWFPAWTTWFIGNVALLLTELIALRHLWLCDCLLFKTQEVASRPFPLSHPPCCSWTLPDPSRLNRSGGASEADTYYDSTKSAVKEPYNHYISLEQWLGIFPLYPVASGMRWVCESLFIRADGASCKFHITRPVA